MCNLWKFCKTHISELKTAEYFFLFVLVLVSAVMGGILWICIHPFIPETTDWFFCLIGVPAVSLYLSGILYLYHYES